MCTKWLTHAYVARAASYLVTGHPLSSSSHLTFNIPPPSANSHGLTIISSPNVCTSDKYARNRYIFNLGLVALSTPAAPSFTPLIRKLSSALLSAEITTGYVSNGNVEQLLPSLFNFFSAPSSHSSSYTAVLGGELISLRLVSPVSRPPLPEVRDHHIPYLSSHSIHNNLPGGYDGYDLTVPYILPHITGEVSAKQIR